MLTFNIRVTVFVCWTIQQTGPAMVPVGCTHTRLPHPAALQQPKNTSAHRSILTLKSRFAEYKRLCYDAFMHAVA